jgi:hypothetical protein
MTQWTVVIKSVPSVNGSGEWPYAVRAWDEEEAIAKAKEAHRIRFPKWNKIKGVQDVVEWRTIY